MPKKKLYYFNCDNMAEYQVVDKAIAMSRATGLPLEAKFEEYLHTFLNGECASNVRVEYGVITISWDVEFIKRNGHVQFIEPDLKYLPKVVRAVIDLLAFTSVIYLVTSLIEPKIVRDNDFFFGSVLCASLFWYLCKFVFKYIKGTNLFWGK